MSRTAEPSRRAVLRGAVWSAVVLSSTAYVPSAAAAPSPEDAEAARLTSQNGWAIEDRADDVSTVWTRPVPGTGLTVPVRLGVGEAVLVNLVRRVHYEIAPLLPGDLLGWQPLGTTSTRSPASNLASGTAVRIRPDARSDAYFPFEEAVLRDILAATGGVVRWGGDDAEPDDSLFYISSGPDNDTTQVVARDLRTADETPGQGAGRSSGRKPARRG